MTETIFDDEDDDILTVHNVENCFIQNAVIMM